MRGRRRKTGKDAERELIHYLEGNRHLNVNSCMAHFYKTEETYSGMTYQPIQQKCFVKDCDRYIYDSGLCETHFATRTLRTKTKDFEL